MKWLKLVYARRKLQSFERKKQINLKYIVPLNSGCRCMAEVIYAKVAPSSCYACNFLMQISKCCQKLLFAANLKIMSWNTTQETPFDQVLSSECVIHLYYSLSFAKKLIEWKNLLVFQLDCMKNKITNLKFEKCCLVKAF